jgi:hypothetical protein
MRIAIDCLKCGHCTSVSADKLLYFGLEPNASLVTLAKRLVCKECGSKSAQTYRCLDDEEGPSMIPRELE